HPRWLDRGAVRQRVGVCHLQPSAPDARVHAREPAGALPGRRRDPSRRDHRGKDLPVRALWPVGGLLSISPGRLSRGRRTLARTFRLQREADRLGARRRLALRPRARLALGSGGLAVRARLVRAATARTRPAQRREAAQAGLNDARPLVDVAVGLVFDRDGRVLLGRRPAGKPYAGWWEFPGGKVEAGESVAEALARELHEELGLVVRVSDPWIVREHSYPHARVRLHFRR